MEEQVRIDKWLWAVRVFKTRSQASEACRGGKVKVNGQNVKPSREVRIGDEITINLGIFAKTMEVISLLSNRVSAKLVPEHAKDLTPQEEYNKQKMMREVNFEVREKGLGRPTKKARRLIVRLKRDKF
jgi:ribosome-associated heat shock protein Hsp15